MYSLLDATEIRAQGSHVRDWNYHTLQSITLHLIKNYYLLAQWGGQMVAALRHKYHWLAVGHCSMRKDIEPPIVFFGTGFSLDSKRFLTFNLHISYILSGNRRYKTFVWTNQRISSYAF